MCVQREREKHRLDGWVCDTPRSPGAWRVCKSLFLHPLVQLILASKVLTEGEIWDSRGAAGQLGPGQVREHCWPKDGQETMAGSLLESAFSAQGTLWAWGQGEGGKGIQSHLYITLK